MRAKLNKGFALPRLPLRYWNIMQSDRSETITFSQPQDAELGLA